MRNKILIVDANKSDQKHLEKILDEIVKFGGELFFAESKEVGLEILEKEKPQLVFLDAPLIGEEEDLWVQNNEIHLVVMRSKEEAGQQSEDTLIKPLKAEQVLQKCREALDLTQPASEIRPM